MTAKIKLNAASGGGSVSIQAPSSSSNNRVISLPDIADGTLVTSQSTLDATKLSGALPAISGANLTGLSSGLAMSDLWRLDTGFSGGQVPINANWSRPTGGNTDADTYGTLGTGMTQSSGVFTFPSTGIYTVFFAAGWYYTSDSSNLAAYITVTYDNGSNWTRAASGKTSIPDYSSFNVYQQTSCWHQMDVTDTSNRKVRFEIETHHSPNLEGTNAENRTYVLFQKLGDT